MSEEVTKVGLKVTLAVVKSELLRAQKDIEALAERDAGQTETINAQGTALELLNKRVRAQRIDIEAKQPALGCAAVRASLESRIKTIETSREKESEKLEKVTREGKRHAITTAVAIVSALIALAALLWAFAK